MLATAAALLLPGLALAAPLASRQTEGTLIRYQTTDTCLTVQPGVNGRFSNGNAVVPAKCGEGPFSLNGPTQRFIINRGAGPIRLAGSNFCLDAGSDPRSGEGMKIWTCYDGLAAQNWYYTDDDRIAVTGDDQCLDFDASATKLQTWQCSTGNDHQEFTTADDDGSVSPEPTPEPTPDASAIHPFGIEGLCVSVAQPFTNGNTASVYPCNGQDSQNFEIQRGSGKIRMRADPSFCLDAGVEPHNGVDLKIWSCLDDVPQQQWFYTDDGRIAVEGRGQCIDVRDGSRAPGAELQTWECSTGNGNQEFSTFRV